MVAMILIGLAAATSLQTQPAPGRLSAPNGTLPESFTTVTSVRELSDGRVLISDPRESVLVVADFDKQQVSSVARKGQGPTEFVLAGPFFPLGADSSVSVDGFSYRWLLFEGTRVVSSRNANHPETRHLRSVLGFDSRGNGATVQPPTNIDKDGLPIRVTDSAFVVLVSRSSAALDTVARLRAAPPGSPARPPFHIAVGEQATLTVDGWLVVARLEPYRVDWRRPDGTWIRGRPLPDAEYPLSNADKEYYQSRLLPEQRTRTVRWPENLPPFLSFERPIQTMDGRALIRRATPIETGTTLYDVVNRNGQRERQIVMPRNHRIVGFGAKSVYVVRKDDMDLEAVYRHPWN